MHLPALSEITPCGAGVVPHLCIIKGYHNSKNAITRLFVNFFAFIRLIVSSSVTKLAKMPGLLQEPQFKHITVKEIGPTFAAEVEGVDFSHEIPQEVFDEIVAAITKVIAFF